MPSPEDTLKSAAHSYVSGEEKYGNAVETNTLAADIATLLLGKTVTPYEICLISMAIKQAHIVKNPGLQKNYEDLINFTTFAAAFAPAPSEVQVKTEVQPRKLS